MIVRHPGFNCLICRKLLNGFSKELSIGDVMVDGERYEIENYSLCEGCGAAYLISRSDKIDSVEQLSKLHPKHTWKLVSDDLVPAEVRECQAFIRAAPAFMTKGGNS